MENIFIPVTEKDFAAIKVAKDYSELKNVEYSKIVREKVGILLRLINSLKEEDVKIPSWMVWSEALIHKLAFHSVTLLNLFEGTEIPFEVNEMKVKVLDKPSIITLLRVVTENFLTFNYLYGDCVSDEEKQFRLSVWRYCGIKQRTEFELQTQGAKNKQIEELTLLKELKNEILGSPFYGNYKIGQQKEILNGRKPRLFNSWVNLIEESGLRVRLFKNMYGYKSNYSHSEFISVLQVHSGIYVFNPNAELEIELMLLHIIICKSLIKLKTIFPTINNNYGKLDSKNTAEIEFINQFGSMSILDDTEVKDKD
jgi:hypothetical protein